VRGGHGTADRCLVGFDVPIQSSDIGQVGSRHGSALLTDRIEGAYPLQQSTGFAGRQPFGYPACSELGHQRMEATHCLGSQTGELEMALCQHPEHLGVVFAPHRSQVGLPQRRDRHRPGIVGVVLSDLPDPSTRTRDASTAGTSTTDSPRATSCWDNK
jgi:hypothetical protein